MQSSGPPASTAPSSVSSGAPTPAQSVATIPSKAGGNIIRPSQQGAYHVPRGEKKPIVLKSFEGGAAVASIAMPRPSALATVRPGPTGSIVSIRGSSRAPSPASQQPQQGPRTRPANSPAHTRPITPQRSDTPRPSLASAVEKAFAKSPMPLPQGQGRTAPIISQGRVATIPALASQPGQAVQIVTQAVTQAVTLSTSQPSAQVSVQTPMQVVTQATHGPAVSISQPTLANIAAVGTKPRPISQQQAAQAGTMTTLSTNPPAVVLAAPARLASPGLIGVQTGPTRLAVATAVPASGARIVSPSARVPQGRTVTYTSNQMLQSTRLPAAPVRLGTAGRGVVSLHPVVGVTPLKPAPAPVSVASTPGQATSQVSTQTSTIVTGQATQVSSLPSLPPAALRALPVPAQSKVMASAVVTVAAVGGGPVRSVVAAVPPAATTLAPAAVTATPASTAASKTGPAHPQTLATVAARPVAVAGVAGSQVRPAPNQQSVYIQAAPAHRASPGPAGERAGAFPIQQTAYFYEAPPGSFQVANVTGRTYAGGQPYIVQATAARPVGTTVAAVAAQPGSGSAMGSATSTTTANLPVVSSAPGPGPGPGSTAGSTVSTITANVVSTVATAQPGQPGQPPRFNSIMVLDPSRTALPIHAVVPAEGGATGTTYIAADGSLLPVQALPVPVSAAVSAAAQAVVQAGPALSGAGGAGGPPVASQASGAQPAQPPPETLAAPTQIVTQVASVVSQAVTSSSSTGHLPMQIQMVPTPVHIQMHPQGQAQLGAAMSQAGVAVSAPTTTSVAVPMSLAMHPVTIAHAPPHSTTPALHPQAPAPAPGPTVAPTTPSKPNASPRPSILRKRDNEGSPLKAQKNLTPLLQSMGSSSAGPTPAPTLPVTPASTAVTLPTLVVPAAPPLSPPSPPKRPDSGGPQSSGSTTISATSSPGQESPPAGVGQPPPSAASITAGLHAAGLAGLGTEMSPRKKPRKQQLTGNELQEHKMSDEEMEFLAEDNGDDFPINQQPQEQQQLHQQVLQQQQQQAALPPPPAAPREFTLKRPNISLLSSYRYSWKSRNNHFLRHSDVKPKDERRPSVNELASQRHIYQRLNGWKVHHLSAQMEDLADVESQVCQQLEAMLGVMERKAEQDEDKDVNRVNELIKGNMQRSRVIADQLIEAKATVMKIFDHKPHVSDIIHRSSGKRERIFKKREKS